MKVETSGQDLPAGIEALRGRKDHAALRAVAKEMESIFAYEMMKAMRKTVGGSGDGKGFGNDVYGTLFDMELGRILSERGMGLREMLLKELGGETARAKPPGPLHGGNETREGGKTGAKPTAAPQVLIVPEETVAEQAPAPVCGDCAKPLLPAEAPEADEAFPITEGSRVSSRYGFRKDPFTGARAFHRGIDIAAPEGTPIHPIRSGRVVFSGRLGGFGNMVMVDHGEGFLTRYAHNSVNFVREDDFVGPDTVIGLVGSTGRSTGPHLHFEVMRNGENIDPAPVFEAKSIKDLRGTSDNPVGRTPTGKDDA